MEPKGVSLFQVVLICGIIQAISLYGLQALHAANQHDYETFETSFSDRIAKSLKRLREKLEGTPTEKQVSNLASISAKNTKSIVELQANLGGIKISDLQKQLTELKEKLGDESHRRYLDIGVVARDLETFENKVQKNVINEAKDIRRDLYKIIDEILEKQNKFDEKIEKGLPQSDKIDQESISDLNAGLEAVSKSIESLEKENLALTEKIDPAVEKIINFEQTLGELNSDLYNAKLDLTKKILSLESDIQNVKNTADQIQIVQESM